MYMV